MRIPFRALVVGVAVMVLSGALAGAAQRYRSFCGWCDYKEPCGKANQATCTSGSACDSGYLSWDIPDQKIDCPGICGPDEYVTYGCYDPNNPPSCSLCGGDGEPPCPSGSGCSPGCDPGTNLAGNLCYNFGCGDDLELPCANGQCINGVELQAGVCVNCGGNHEPVCLFGDACRYGTGDIGLDSTGLIDVCAYCGGPPGPNGEDGTIACEGGVCNSAYYHATTDVLDGDISNCDTFFTGNEQIHYVNQNGICSPGWPDTMARPAPESWPSVEAPEQARGTILIIHGRGASCGPAKERMLDVGGLYDTGNLIYCVEYAQENTPGVDRRSVKIYPVLDDLEGHPQPPCTADTSCEFDETRPVAEELAPTFDVPGVATALHDLLLQIPTVGEITLMPHSQGGFIARQLVYRYYDDLRWNGKKISRVISLGHPYYAKQEDPHLYTPWLCASEDSFDCATGKWTWGWSDNVLNTPGAIDDTDYPQIDWTVVSGDGPPGSTSPEAQGDACTEIFGGVPRSVVAGDTSVPIMSSLGYEEFGFPFPVRELSFDRRYHTSCTHTASCMISTAMSGSLACGAAGGSPPPPADSCWGVDPQPSLLPSPGPPPLPAALAFDGDDHVAATDPSAISALTMTSALTLEAWINPEVAGQSTAFLNKEGEYEIGVLPNGGKSVLAWAVKIGSPTWTWTYTTFEPPANEWTHVALTYNGSSVVVYANGYPVQTTSISGSIGDQTPGQNELWIGGRQATSYGFKGLMKDVRVWSRALSRPEVIAGMGGDPGAGNTSGLAGWWKLDEGFGDLVADSGPNGFDLSLSGAGPGLSPVRRGEGPTGRIGGALLFDGVDDHVAVSEPSAMTALEMHDALTIEAWIYPRNPSSGGGGVIVNKEGEYALTRWGDGRITWSLANTSPGWVSVQSTYVAPAHAWTHVAFVYDDVAGEARLYINGAPYQTWTATGPIGDFHASNDELQIGGRQNSPTSQPFHGVIDDVRVWNRALSDSEIAQDFGKVIVDPSSRTGLVGYWKFDETSGGVAFDSAAGHHATLGNDDPTYVPARTLAPALPGESLVYPACGDGNLDPGEGCDDGGTDDGDGCSSACRPESHFDLHGSAQGGTVTIVVEGVTIQITTSPGQTTEEVIAALAAAIQSDFTLASMHVTASAVNGDLIVGGAYSGVDLSDPGLTDCTAGPSPVISGSSANACPATMVSLSTGAYSTYQWSYEGQAIPGATGPTYDATLTGNYSVDVSDGAGCPASSLDALTLVSFCPDSEASPAGAIFPLRVEPSASSSTGYYVYFQRLDGAAGYNLYSGSLAGAFDHGNSSDNVCDLPFTDLGTGELRAELPLPAGDAVYFLISPFSGGDEGVTHLSSTGVPADPSQSTCPP